MLSIHQPLKRICRREDLCFGKDILFTSAWESIFQPSLTSFVLLVSSSTILSLAYLFSCICRSAKRLSDTLTTEDLLYSSFGQHTRRKLSPFGSSSEYSSSVSLCQAYCPSIYPQISQKSNATEEKGRKKKRFQGEYQARANHLASGDGKTLPTRLVQMWTEIDQALPRADIQKIFHATFAEYTLAKPPAQQPWMQAANKSSVIAIEKARIANGGKIPASWKAAAEQSEHGRKWLKIGREQEQAAALARAREDMAKKAADETAARDKVVETAAQYNEINRKAQNALEDSKSAATQSKTATEWAKTAAERATQAKEAADKVCEEADHARIAFMDSRAARDQASLVASNAAAKVKTLEEEAKKAGEVAPPSKKRKLGTSKIEDASLTASLRQLRHQ